MSDRSDDSPRPPAPSEADWDAIARCLAGEGDPVEAARVRAWLTAHPEDAALVEAVKAHTARIERRADVAVDTEAALTLVRARLTANDRLHVVSGERQPVAGRARHRWRLVGFAVAAGLAAVATLTQFRTGSAPTASREYVTAVGQRDSVRLPDGTTVMLAPGSRLTVAAEFGRERREVMLEGAAYFDVRHDASRPFLVRTASADIRDLGTAFAVKTAEAGEVTVDVTHGIVALRALDDSATAAELHAGDRGVLARAAVTVRRGTVTAADVAWTRGELSYRDASLAEVRADLRRWYGIDLRVTDSTMAARTFTASFRGDSAAAVVRVLALALGAEVTQRGDTVTLQPSGAAAVSPP